MTYADMITLLLCFFAVFLSVSVPKKEKFERARKEVIQKFGTPDTVQSTTDTRDVPKKRTSRRFITRCPRSSGISTTTGGRARPRRRPSMSIKSRATGS
jgi:flagellar motor protein MotB